MVNYELGKIYKIVCDKTGLIYVGSTAQKYISLRLGGHRSAYRNYKRNGCKYTTSFRVLENYCERIELIEMWPCSNNYELQKRERYWIERLNCVNKFIPTRTKEEYIKEYYENNKDKIKEHNKEYRDNNREKIKVYYENNKEKIKEFGKVYYENNKEKIKEYRDNNKVKMKEYNKEYYENNKDKIKEKDRLYYENNKDKKNQQSKVYRDNNKERKKELRDYKNSWCGNFVYNNHNNLLRIDVNLFN